MVTTAKPIQQIRIVCMSDTHELHRESVVPLGTC
jgi:hypothetical protein